MSYDCYCDYDAPAFYNRAMRRSRKDRACYECGGKILRGETYECVTGKWDYVDTFHTCERCVDLRTWTKNNVPCLCWAHGNMHDDCREAVLEAFYRAPQETVGLRFGFLRRATAIDRFNKARSAQTIGMRE